METMDVYAVLRESLAGLRPMDDAARQLATVMADRLEELKRRHPLLAGIELSPDMQQLAERSEALLVS